MVERVLRLYLAYRVYSQWNLLMNLPNKAMLMTCIIRPTNHECLFYKNDAPGPEVWSLLQFGRWVGLHTTSVAL